MAAAEEALYETAAYKSSRTGDQDGLGVHIDSCRFHILSLWVKGSRLGYRPL